MNAAGVLNKLICPQLSNHEMLCFAVFNILFHKSWNLIYFVSSFKGLALFQRLMDLLDMPLYT